jgi:hypothetical protein
MAKRKSAKREEQTLKKLSQICLALPETVRRDSGDHADFRVRGKVFAYFLNNHHGDGIVAVCCKAALGENVDRASREPKRVWLKARWSGDRLVGSSKSGGVELRIGRTEALGEELPGLSRPSGR